MVLSVCRITFLLRNAEKLRLTTDRRFVIMHFAQGDVSEWLKEAVLKTVDVRASVGSNPTISASYLIITYAEVPKWL